MAQASTAGFRKRLESSRTSLMDAIAGLDEEGFRARPAVGGWTAAEVLAHVLHIEGLHTDRARAALARDGFVATVVSEEECDRQARLAQRMAVPQILHGLLAQRRDTLQLLEGLNEDQIARAFHHPERGEVTVGTMFERAAGHEEEHADQIRALRAQHAPAS